MRVWIDQQRELDRLSRKRTSAATQLRLAAVTAIVALATTLAPSPSGAQEGQQASRIPASDRPYSHRRYSAGLSIIGAVATTKDLDPSPGVQVRLGGRFHRRFAADIFGEWHARFDDDSRHYTAWGVGSSLRGYFMTGRIQPFLLVGGGIIQTRQGGSGNSKSDLGFAPRGGLGIDYYLSRDIAVTLDASYVAPVGRPRGLDFVSVNLGFQWY